MQNNQKSNNIILVVEDNVDLQLFIKNELNAEYEIIIADNGEHGLEKIAEKTPHLIISDIMMPVMDGIEFSKRVRTDENTSHIPIILLTAKHGEENKLLGLESGAIDYITKPFNINILKTKISNLFQLQNQLRIKYKNSIDVTPSEITYSKIDEEFLKRALQIVKDNLKDHDFSNEVFVEKMNHSRTVVYTKIKKITGQSLSEFIKDIRLKEAAKMFLEGNDNIADVCYLVGFKNRSFFTRSFSQLFNVPPKQFIKDKVIKKVQ